MFVRKIAFAKSGQNLQPIHKTIPPRNVTQQGSKRKRGGSKKGTTANFHTWKWKHVRVQDYEQIPKGNKTSWLMKKGISRANMSRWRLHFENHEFDPHSELKKQCASQQPRKLKYATAEEELYCWYRSRRAEGYSVTRFLLLL